MFLLYHSEGRNICEMVLHECYINDLHTTTCSGMLGHHRASTRQQYQVTSVPLPYGLAALAIGRTRHLFVSEATQT
jgi:hypothetical protein